MSRENVEIVRRGYEVLNSRDFSRIPEFLDPEIEIDITRNVINPGVWRGFEGFEEMIRGTDDVWDSFHDEVLETIDAGDHVVSRVKTTARGGQSGAVAEMELFHVATLRDGKIIRLVGGIQSRAEALALAGLPE
jgi:ketosteroid isomerase-like protein